MAYGAEHARALEYCLLPVGSDLKRALVVALLEWVDAGWRLGEFSSMGDAFFCTRAAERSIVSITPSAPDHLHNYGASHQAESPGREN